MRVKPQGDLMGETVLKKVAEQYMGVSREEITRIQTDLGLKESIIQRLKRYLQDVVEEGEADRRLLIATTTNTTQPSTPTRKVSPKQPPQTPFKVFKPDVPVSTSVKSEKIEDKPEVFIPPTRYDFIAPKVEVKTNTTDYLADTYDECVESAVNATTRLHQAATADLKAFDGKSRDEYGGKSWLSSVRAAFRRDQLTPGEACVHFPDLLTHSAKIRYRQLPRHVRASWPSLQAEFEQEYCVPPLRYNTSTTRSHVSPMKSRSTTCIA